MDYRWVFALAVWTILSGPVFGPPRATPTARHDRTTAASSAQTVPSPPPASRR